MNRFLTLILVLICLTGFAQTEVSLELGKKDDVLDIAPLGNYGFMIKTGSKKEIQLASFRADLSRRWVQKVSTTTDKYSNNIVVSPEGNSTYLVDGREFYEESKSPIIHVVRIDSTGKRENLDYAIKSDQKGAEGIALFADDDNLYRLGAVTTFSQDNGKRKIVTGEETGTKESKIVLLVMNKSEKEVRSVETDIKLTEEHVRFYKYQFIEYLGHDNEYIYLVKKNVNPSQNIITYEVFILDRSGKTIETTEFVASISSKITQSMSIRSVPGAIVFDDDYFFESKNGVYYYGVTEGAYGCAKLDLNNGYLYVYGLSRNNKFPIAKHLTGDNHPNEETNANTIYVCKFDFNTGDLISKNEIQFDKSMLENVPFANPIFGIASDRYIWLDIVDSETVRFGGTSKYLYSKGLLHVTALNTRTSKTAYIGKSVEISATLTRFEKYVHNRRLFANALVTRLDASQATIDYINKFPDFNEKHFQVLGLCLGDKTVLALKSDKTHKVEFHLLDNANR